jgi:hypothetical protein
LISSEALLAREISVNRDGGARMDVYQILMQDHQLIQQIFSEIGQTENSEVE